MTARRTTNTNRRSRIARNKNSHHLLEVKMRSDTARRQRTRKVQGLILKITLGLFLVGGSYFGGIVLLDKFFFKNPDYNIQNIQASLDDVVTLPELKAATGLHEGMNIFSFHLGAAEKVLSDLPEVKKAHVERVLPNTIQVTIERRVPIFRIAASSEESFIPGQSLVMDGEGMLMAPSKLNAALLELPILEGVSMSNAHLGQALQDEKLSFVLALWNALNNSGNTLLTLRSIDLSHRYCAIVTDTNNTHFTFGEENLSAQIERLQKLLSYCQENERQLETANLMLEHNTPVTFRPNAEAVSLTAQNKTR